MAKLTALLATCLILFLGLVRCKMRVRYFGPVPEPCPEYPFSRYQWIASVLATIPRTCHDNVTAPKECSVTTEPTIPMSYMFVLPDLVAPFKLNFAVRTIDSGIIALATGRTEEDIFCHITIGGWENSKAALRTGVLKTEHIPGSVIIRSSFQYPDQLSVDEYRPFWIEYENGVIRVGKGCERAPFLEWDGTADVGSHPMVNIGISTWEAAPGDWVFEENCF